MAVFNFNSARPKRLRNRLWRLPVGQPEEVEAGGAGVARIEFIVGVVVGVEAATLGADDVDVARGRDRNPRRANVARQFLTACRAIARTRVLVRPSGHLQV